jgi:hypothetical protein
MDMDAEHRAQLDARVNVAERTLRKVVERAIAFYVNHAPAEQISSLPAALPPRRGQSRRKRR